MHDTNRNRIAIPKETQEELCLESVACVCVVSVCVCEWEDIIFNIFIIKIKLGRINEFIF